MRYLLRLPHILAGKEDAFLLQRKQGEKLCFLVVGSDATGGLAFVAIMFAACGVDRVDFEHEACFTLANDVLKG
ncbi:hypothetical protein Ct61P_14872 [Colletotrichum tofieldiae]|nr:hypothetical protein Ct61P_14872 [Colletotrichum tofieldiae]